MFPTNYLLCILCFDSHVPPLFLGHRHVFRYSLRIRLLSLHHFQSLASQPWPSLALAATSNLNVKATWSNIFGDLQSLHARLPVMHSRNQYAQLGMLLDDLLPGDVALVPEGKLRGYVMLSQLHLNCHHDLVVTTLEPIILMLIFHFLKTTKTRWMLTCMELVGWLKVTKKARNQPQRITRPERKFGNLRGHIHHSPHPNPTTAHQWLLITTAITTANIRKLGIHHPLTTIICDSHLRMSNTSEGMLALQYLVQQ